MGKRAGETREKERERETAIFFMCAEYTTKVLNHDFEEITMSEVIIIIIQHRL